MPEEFYWVIHIVGGQRSLHGPYKTRNAAEAREQRIHGGEVHVLRTWTDNPTEADNQFVGEIAGE